jgi:hypothetical protein
MAEGLNPAPESWRIVVFTNIPGGVIYSLVDGVVRPLGHRVVGVVTSPGPKRRRSSAYLEVVAAVPPGSTSSSPTIPSAGRQCWLRCGPI